jgi:hypothetical protein
MKVTKLVEFKPIASFLIGALVLLGAMATAGCATQKSVESANVQLVTPGEVAQNESDVAENFSTPLSGDEPIIEVAKPIIVGGKVSSPVSIIVSFKAAAGRLIDPATFKLFYGMFKIDVTERLLKTSKVTADGFSIDKADIPAGSHRLILRVSDDTGAVGLKEIKFKIAE